MNMRLTAACALLMTIGMAAGRPAAAHRLDEYLQATTISLEQGRIEAQIRLTPGVAVFPGVFAGMDANADGLLSAAEQQAYAERMARDLSLSINGNRLRLRLDAWKFARTEEMKEGRGEIQLDFHADVPRAAPNRTLVFENHHQERIAVYLVNCLVPSDPTIQVTAQKRNYQQSHYELNYVQAGVPSALPPVVRRPEIPAWLYTAPLILLMLLTWLRRRAR